MRFWCNSRALQLVGRVVRSVSRRLLPHRWVVLLPRLCLNQSSNYQKVNDAPEEGRDTTAEGRASGPQRGTVWITGSVSYLLSADRVSVTPNASRLSLLSLRPLAGQPPQGRGALASAETAQRSRRSPPAKGSPDRDDRERGRCGAVPSAGWREVAEAYHCEEGMVHE